MNQKLSPPLVASRPFSLRCFSAPTTFLWDFVYLHFTLPRQVLSAPGTFVQPELRLSSPCFDCLYSLTVTDPVCAVQRALTIAIFYTRQVFCGGTLGCASVASACASL